MKGRRLFEGAFIANILKKGCLFEGDGGGRLKKGDVYRRITVKEHKASHPEVEERILSSWFSSPMNPSKKNFKPLMNSNLPSFTRFPMFKPCGQRNNKFVNKGVGRF